MRLGAHVSTSGGLSNAVDRGLAIGAQCLQIFASSPRMWRPPVHGDAEVLRFRTRLAETGLGPVFIHTIYLLNPASSDGALRAKSIDSLARSLEVAERLGSAGAITHLGSGQGASDGQSEEMVVRSLAEVLERAPEGASLLLETAAGRTIGHDFAQLGRIIRGLANDERLAVCLDTAHVFAAGYDFRSPEGLEAMLDQFEQEIGLRRLTAIHVNDSKVPAGSGRDRHENLGHGHIGEEAFAMLLHHPALRHLPFVLEVPGFDGEGPDRENVAILRRLAGLRELAA